jgi:hypothetical protein
MAVVTSIMIAARNVRVVDVGEFSIDYKPVLPAAANADNIQLFTAPCDMRLNTAHLKVPTGLGASATLKMQRNRAGVRTDITAATTANTAGVVNAAGIAPLDLLAGDIIELLVGGGALTSGTVEYDLLVRRA